jgi:hypothetical protein
MQIIDDSKFKVFQIFQKENQLFEISIAEFLLPDFQYEFLKVSRLVVFLSFEI